MDKNAAERAVGVVVGDNHNPYQQDLHLNHIYTFNFIFKFTIKSYFVTTLSQLSLQIV